MVNVVSRRVLGHCMDDTRAFWTELVLLCHGWDSWTVVMYGRGVEAVATEAVLVERSFDVVMCGSGALL